MYRLVEILLVEDSLTERYLTLAAIHEAEMTNVIHCVADGVEAMAFLHKEGKYVDAKRPCLILLDLNMPRLDGRAVLKLIKADPSLRSIPIIILTTSSSPLDIADAYDNSANGYMAKPLDFKKFCKEMKTLKEFWFQVALLPKEGM